MRDFVDKTPESVGTPINRDYLMAIQGFDAILTKFYSDGKISETNKLGDELVTSFENGVLVERFYVQGNLKITKTTKFKVGGLEETVVEEATEEVL